MALYRQFRPLLAPSHPPDPTLYERDGTRAGQDENSGLIKASSKGEEEKEKNKWNARSVPQPSFLIFFSFPVDAILCGLLLFPTSTLSIRDRNGRLRRSLISFCFAWLRYAGARISQPCAMPIEDCCYPPHLSQEL